MRALDAKLLRDLRRLWAQALAIAVVLASGVMVLVVAHGAQRSLVETRAAYYERNRFPDVFASATRAPETLLAEIAALAGVAQVEGRIAARVILDMPDMLEPAMAQVVSLPASGTPVLNLPVVRSGRLPDPLRPEEVAVNEGFARAHGLVPGAEFRAILNGQVRSLTVTGLLLAPEFIYVIGPDTMMPDDRRFGVIWMGAAAAAAVFDLDGAFNDLALRLVAGADPAPVVAALDRLLAPFGGTGAYGRDRHIGYVFLASELEQLEAMAAILPPVFFVVAAFLVNMVLGRLIALERQQIGLMKAVGYGTGAIAGHYLKLATGIGILGVALGWAAGAVLGQGMTALYARFFNFPWLIFTPGVAAFALSGVVGVATAVVGALRGVRGAVRLAPAVAMSPPAPPAFRRGLLDRIGAAVGLRQTTMMILRSITRWPGRAAVTLFGVAASVSMLVASLFSFDAMDAMVEEVFVLGNRQQITLALAQSRPRAAVEEALALPGVLAVEGAWGAPVRIARGTRSRLIAIEARPETGSFVRVLDVAGRPVALPPAGVVLTEGIAAELDVGPGELIEVAFLVPPRETHALPVTGIIRQSLGQQIYMAEDALFALLRIAPQVNRLNLLVDPAALPTLHAQVKVTPALGGISIWGELRAQFDATLEENLTMMLLIYVTLGGLITLGVVYNAARIQLAERSHELASLRVLGFSRGEVGFVLVGEMMLLATAAIPLGWLIGIGFASMVVAGFSTEMVTIPLVILPHTYATAALVAFLAALAAALMVRRRLDSTDIAMALKARE
ncbi:MAG: ABC transporter permease [Rhodobacteraceae bacterium]|jgi:putative ABC transport system permease protein|nr:ABC transporter permease [Paracoccaceae bacterium]